MFIVLNYEPNNIILRVSAKSIDERYAFSTTYLNALANFVLNSSSKRYPFNRSLLESFFCCLELLHDEFDESSFRFFEDILHEL